ncbi:MAG TPA: ATP-dependent metallopeptidase FtsH/Yme1/Tma family protein, partial [Candidatus Mediterraneibacter excrementigallinarum]|nr:ATP-dependent metallopeptidase FtsH/Yme1/Tma family protein [Candidatus Mediterraneibacter excrementigallinarum]
MDNQNNKNNGPDNNRQSWGIILITTLLVTFVVMGLYSLMQGSSPEEISYDKFLELVDDGKVDEVTLGSTRIYITLKDDADTDSDGTGTDNADQSSGAAQPPGMNEIISQIEQQTEQRSGQQSEPDYYTGVVNDDTLPQRLEKAGVTFSAEVPDTAGSLIFEVFVTVILPIVLLVILFNFLMKRMTKGGGMMGIGKSNAKMYMEKVTGVTFQDVAGEDDATESLQEVVDFLHNPQKYSGIGAKLPKGALL